MLEVDLNCDMGESFGAYTIGADAELLQAVTSANIACGFHAGDPAVMRKSVRSALAAGVSVGAHPGLPDLAGFGRRNMDISPEEAFDLVTYQIGALEAFVRQEGGRLRHVKPHGALYNMAAASRPLADAIAAAVRRFDPSLVLYGLSGSQLLAAGREAGLSTASEVFADRTYQRDGALTPRRQPGAVIADMEQLVRQVIRMVKEGTVLSLDGTEVPLEADTVCIHGDGAGAAVFAGELRNRLKAEGITVRAKR
ncbi:LamB/YcsF family protein [Paenibacillus rhizophilus]|uniref:5-oxoprolinase subunit A n=1 Tax=Paenibacillus rhizophilus TaxID=1850366 RepID=A0A3N9PXR1_9BACL|nr:5-oxoprolinase subunit PxpA [Paenibacillus rhizophilus]RQW11182.1 LamB/YcsF family protein [Paenibacillus rhizophilus]